MKLIMCLIRLGLVELISLRFMGGVRIGLTGCMNGIPDVSVRNNGKIRIARHCLLKKCTLAAVNGGVISVKQGTSLGMNDIIISHERINIGERCSLAPNICIYDHDHCFDSNGKTTGFNTGEVNIGNNVWIGAGAIILRNTSIGDNCVIGAGTVVKGVIPSNSIVTGNRTMVVKSLK